MKSTALTAVELLGARGSINSKNYWKNAYRGERLKLSGIPSMGLQSKVQI